MRKIIIPRKDHEVYFLPGFEDNRKNGSMKQYILDNIVKLHPGFSIKSKLDIKIIKFNKIRWIMITVMEEENLIEYKLINKNSFLFTNTSVMLNDKNFINNGIKIINDEKIGFDSLKNEPISIPVGKYEENTHRKLEEKIKKISLRFAVFKKKIPIWFMLFSGIVLIIAIILIIFIHNVSKYDSERYIVNILHPQQEENNITINTQKKYLPPIIEILASISTDVTEAGGKIVQWQSGDHVNPFFSIQIQGIDLINTYRMFIKYDYVTLQDIHEIRYGDNNPYILIGLNINEAEYAVSSINSFPMYDDIFNIFTELSAVFLRNNISINSEILPTAGNKYQIYSINYSTIGWNIILSFDTITDYCYKNNLHIKNLDINFNNNIFYINCTLSYNDDEYISKNIISDEKFNIPTAFGYSRIESFLSNTDTGSINNNERLIENNEPIIGSIKDENNNIIFFRDNSNGKIQVRIE